jgi:hypothetical protein
LLPLLCVGAAIFHESFGNAEGVFLLKIKKNADDV